MIYYIVTTSLCVLCVLCVPCADCINSQSHNMDAARRPGDGRVDLETTWLPLSHPSGLPRVRASGPWLANPPDDETMNRSSVAVKKRSGAAGEAGSPGVTNVVWPARQSDLYRPITQGAIM